MLQRLREDARYPELFRTAFPDEKDPLHEDNVVKALASFQHTMLSGNSPYDRYLQGDINALSSAAKRGMELFFGECSGPGSLPARSLSGCVVERSVFAYPSAFAWTSHSDGCETCENAGTEEGSWLVTFATTGCWAGGSLRSWVS
ncbi:MAG TPA: cytochrome-c peroxidase [Archangium sp.]|nr:cytochrome-c peroxidase [Archangium sp.]